MDYPGEKALAHQTSQWIKSSVSTLSPHGLMVVAINGEPAVNQSIIDIPMDAYVELPPTDPYYQKRKSERIQAERQNEKKYSKLYSTVVTVCITPITVVC